MSFASVLTVVAERVLSDRSLTFIVEPALADLQYENQVAGANQLAGNIALLRAIAGALRDDLANNIGGFLALLILPAGYYVCLWTICGDFFSAPVGVAPVLMVIGLLSLGPAVVCFWPERRERRIVS